MAVGNLVKKIQQKMRQDAGINGDAQCAEQMAWLIFLKVYDALEKEWEFKQESFLLNILRKPQTNLFYTIQNLKSIFNNIRNCLKFT